MINNRFSKDSLVIRKIFVLAFLGLVACSSEKNTPTSRAYHNVLAKYNGYFLAREKTKEVENNIVKAHKENYNRILEIYQPISAATETSIKPLTEEIVKKASIPVQRHKYSKWVDDSYLLIGRARYYQADWENATTTYRYVYGKAKGKDEKSSALIWLLRTYVSAGEPKMASIARSVLEKEAPTFSKANTRDYHLTMAFYHYKLREYKEVAENLDKALPLMRRGEARARLYYALGQIRQKQHADSAAYKSFRAVLKNNPSYELSFYTKLNLAQVTSVSDEKGKKRIRKYFKKMLKDEKNEEYRDRVYYEMASFELKQGNVPKAIEYYQTSLRQKTTNPNQKAYSYLRLGEIFYDKLHRYPQAKEYYDSTITAPLDTNEENYAAILKRQKVLGDFVREYTIVQREDSLQRLAAMDTATLYATIDKMVAGDIARDKEDARRKEREARKAASGGGNGSSMFDNKNGLGFNSSSDDGNSDTKWALSNPAAISAGRAAFLQKWGNRPLQDNWRRSKKDSAPMQEENNPSANATEEPKDSPTDTANKSEKATEKTDDGKGKTTKAAAPERNRSAYLKDIPFTAQALAASNEKLRPALYNLGKIYRQKLEEPDNAATTFEHFVEKFYEDEKTPEVLYFLYLIYKEKGMAEKQEVCKQKLLKDFPKSDYAGLLRNPNYLVEKKAQEAQAEKDYAVAYELYEQNRMAEAEIAVNKLRDNYPETVIMDKIVLLQTLIAGHTLAPSDYVTRINEFMKNYPKSKLIPLAQEMNAVAVRVASGQSAVTSISEATSTSNEPSTSLSPYKLDLEKPHYFLVILPVGKIRNTEAMEKISEFNSIYYPERTFTVNDMLINDKYFMVRVWDLPTKIQALNYLKKQKSEKGALSEDYPKLEKHYLLMTADNLKIFYKSKNIKEYEDFFNKHYNLNFE
ncbi:Tetratricopeptide repeat-containing protein [Flexibacter flexilis DSM 6793]|uniref:Tetratricopeptide repeat-containing protein n=1 Tax=Flexibacter flexilis DSM 6793 TaxID=927664 RepID=A0A1I1MVC2_9BACT|nr:tetratricopeptide repeat protein [Flexibacter flexilis]SFC89309.1 Tetratricopeptide repeat-containing protein [Flexibacter flexilis DSM 6793]